MIDKLKEVLKEYQDMDCIGKCKKKDCELYRDTDLYYEADPYEVDTAKACMLLDSLCEVLGVE